MMSCGALAPDSRLARLSAVEFAVVSARLTRPFPVLSEVTSTVVHVHVKHDTPRMALDAHSYDVLSRPESAEGRDKFATNRSTVQPRLVRPSICQV